MVFCFKNCKIKINYSFLLIVAFSISLKSKSILYVLLFSVLHECGHIAALLAFGYLPDEVTFSFYGIAMNHSAKLSPFKELIFLLSGIAVNVFLALIGVHREVNIPLAAVNAFPVIPLDGGRALSFVLSEKAMRIVSAVTLFALIAFAVVTFNYSLLLISIYIGIYSFYEGCNR